MKEAIWQAFRETGDPLCYLLYRAFSGTPDRAAGGQTPKSA
jgi:hypothetical protein